MRDFASKDVGIGLVAALALTVSACSAPSLSSRYRILDEQPATGEPITRRVLLVADNQIHHLYGKPYWIRTELTDKVVPVAIRPVQLDMFGQDLLRSALEDDGGRTPVVHLGDALDLGCAREFDLFLKTMAAAPTWVLTPGNHDGFFAGNLGESPDWHAACENGGGPIDKAHFIARYLRALADQKEDPGSAELRQQKLPPGREPPSRGEWQYQGGGRPFLRRLAWSIDSKSPWQSFVVQEIDLRRIRSAAAVRSDYPLPRDARAILLDTSQYSRAPSFPKGAGLAADVLEGQQEVLRRWGRAEPRGLTILMGHHTYGSLSIRARSFVDTLREETDAALYVSAHTHEGNYYVRGTSGAGSESTWLELNVGSIVDWPPEYRTLQFIATRDERLGDRIAAITPLARVVADRPPACDPAWEAMPGEPDYYLSYQQHASGSAEITQQRLADAMLATFRRLLMSVPTKSSAAWPPGFQTDADVLDAIRRTSGKEIAYAEKIHLLLGLDRFEAERETEDEGKHAAYRACQAIWASKYEQRGARAPAVDDWYFDFPKE